MSLLFINEINISAALIKAKIFDQILNFEYIICGYIMTPSQYAWLSAPNVRKTIVSITFI